MSRTYRLAGCLGLALMMGCAAGPKKEEDAMSRDSTLGDAGVEVRGTVQKAAVGVNCWQFIAADSTRYELRAGQAPPDLLVDQKQATVTLRVRPDLMSTCMVGQIADVVKVAE